MSDLEVVVTASKRYEACLERIGATGKGLHEKTSSVESRLTDEAVGHLRAVASIRNELVHSEGVDTITRPQRFHAACNFLDEYFASLAASQPTNKIGSLDFSRISRYRGFQTDNVRELIAIRRFDKLLPLWEHAAGVRFIDNEPCLRDIEYWVQMLVNRDIAAFVSSQLPRLSFTTSVMPVGHAFEIHRHRTKPSPTCKELQDVLWEASRGPIIYWPVKIGIDSEHQECVLVNSAAIQLKSGFIRDYVVKPAKSQTLVSLVP